MSFFTRFRQALALADEVNRLSAEVQSLQFEWTDVLDKLLAREERWRKRYKAEVGYALATTDEPAQAPAHAASAGDRKSLLRQQLAIARSAQLQARG